MTDATTVLVVDDSAATVEVLTRNLEGHGLRVVSAADVESARQLLRTVAVDLVVTDLKMPGASGIELVRQVRAHHAEIGVVMMTGYPSIETAVEAVKSGAEEYLAKPFTDEELLAVVDRALDQVARRRGTAATPGADRHGLVTAAPQMAPVLRAIDTAARSIDPVLLLGPAGSGRTLAARAIHRGSSRAQRPFVTLSCLGGDGEWLATQLFGTPPPDRAAGLAELADGGSLVLREVEWLPPELQVAVLRAINERATPVGAGGRRRALDVRWIATAGCELTPSCRAGGFRRDLAVALGAVTVTLPPLAQRTGDVAVVAQTLLARRCEQLGRPPVRLSAATVERLASQPWPGEVAQLEAVLTGALAHVTGDVIEPYHLPGGDWSDPVGDATRLSLAEVDAAHIRRVLAMVGDNKTEAARLLGIDRKTLRDRLRRDDETGTGSPREQF